MPGILNIGFDLEEVRRFEKYLSKPDAWDHLLQDVFSPDELQRNNAHEQPAACFTLCFCFKEALSKALGKSWMNAGIDWREMELLIDSGKDFDAFQTRLSGEVSNHYKAQGGRELGCKIASDGSLATCEVIVYT